MLEIYLLISYPFKFGILLWGYEIKKITFLQKKAIRIVTNSHFLAHTSPLFKMEKILKVEDIFNMHCYKFYYALMNDCLPRALSNFFIVRNNDNNDDADIELEFFECSDSNGKKRIRYHLPRFINRSPACIKRKATTHSTLGYTKYAKNYILQTYDDTPCNIQNCYPCRASNVSL